MRLSYSALSTYKRCPRKFKHSYIDKLPRGEAGPAAQRGTKLHNDLEQFMLGKIDELQSPLDHYQEWLESLKEYDCYPEWKFGVNEFYQPCEFEAENAILRGFVDLLLLELVEKTATGYEWKSGKMYPEHKDQTMVYATIILLHHPKVEEVEMIITYLDLNKHDRIVYPRHMLDNYVGELKRRREEILGDEIFIPKPQFLCRYCDFSRAKGGPCQF